MIKYFILHLLLGLFIFSCSTSYILKKDITPMPWKDRAVGGHLERFSIAVTGITDTINSKTLKGYISVLDKKINQNSILLDMGEFQGRNDHLKVTEIIDRYDGVSAIEGNISKVKNKFVNSNIVDVNQGVLKRDLGIPYMVMVRNGVKVGVIFTRKLQWTDNSLYFMDPVLAVIKVKKRLLKEKVNLIALVTEVNSECRALEGEGFVNPKLECNSQDPLLVMIHRLPPGFVDIVINRSEGFYYGKLKDMLVLQIPKGHNVISRAEFYWDKTTKTFDKKRSIAFPPVLMCENFVKDINMCATKEYNGDVRSAIFLGENIN